MLTADQQHVTKPPPAQLLALADHLVDREGAAGDVVAGREPAVGADADALVGEIQRSEEMHGASEAPERLHMRGLRDALDVLESGR